MAIHINIIFNSEREGRWRASIVYVCAHIKVNVYVCVLLLFVFLCFVFFFNFVHSLFALSFDDEAEVYIMLPHVCSLWHLCIYMPNGQWVYYHLILFPHLFAFSLSFSRPQTWNMEIYDFPLVFASMHITHRGYSNNTGCCCCCCYCCHTYIFQF